MEDIKKEWNEMSESFGNDRIKGLREMVKKVTSLEELCSRYKKFSIMSFVMLPMCLFFLIPNMYLGVGATMRIVLVAILELYFAFCGTSDYFLYQKIKSIDIYTLPPVEVASRCASVKKLHLKLMCFLIPCCMCLIGYMIFTFREDIYTIAGIIGGAIIGMALGAVEFIKFMRDYKALI